MKEFLIHAAYLAGATFFIYGLKMMSRVRTAQKGNLVAAAGMGLAILATVFAQTEIGWFTLILGAALGSGAGWVMAKKVEMTSMPEMVALFNGLGGAASVLVALSFYLQQRLQQHVHLTVREGWPEKTVLADGLGATAAVTIVLSILVGGITLTGSVIAYLKLAGKMKGNSILLPNRHLITVGAFAAVFVLGALAVFGTTGAFMTTVLLLAVTAISLALGILLVIPIGGADMPVVISLLNSYSGIAASMTGFVLLGSSQGALMLIVSGALVGASGLILTQLMCKAMNRSLANVLVGGFGETSGGGGKDEYGPVRKYTTEEAALLLDGANQVIVVPGYGLAVAQAQHAIAELDRLLEARGTTVKYAIHPVAGRMPGHMNVLLAEANVPYEKLVEMDDINPEFKNTQVCIVVGANDVTNPAAIKDPKSPIAGMPILNCFESQNVIVIKRSLSAGYAGIKNELFEYPNTSIIFEDAKAAVQGIVNELKQLT